MSWFHEAACLGKHEEMFPSKYKDISYISGAKKICASCKVSSECLEYALGFAASDMFGVWAGLTSRQLAKEAKLRGINE